MGEGMPMRRSSSLVLGGLCVLLVACQTEDGQTIGGGLTKSLVPLEGPAASTSTAALPVTGEAQAYSATPTSKVEASVQAATRSEPHGVVKKSKAAAPNTEPKFNLFKALQENNKRAGLKRTAAARSKPAGKVIRPPAKVGSRRSTLTLLPGVRTQTLEGVRTLGRSAKTKAKELSEPVRVAGAAALARIGRHGLRTQHSKVSVGCLKPDLVRLIKRAERHFGRHAVVTSGYRSPRHNRRVGGARRSMHVSCRAADVQIKGVTKWKLASWFRKQSDRGGVGTYCHTRSVHVDIGEKRDWNWRCKRRRGKKRRS